MISGILLIDKPQGFTSFDVIAKLRGMTRQKKIGHAGTLDPMATGVLVCLFGPATRLCDLLPREDKTYLAEMRLGVTTDTQDLTGRVVAASDLAVSQSALEEALAAFRGAIFQTPPMYSAVSAGGRRLYDLARKGVEVTRSPRRVVIQTLVLQEYDEPQRRALLKISCSKGTYIRTLAHDIGAALGCGAALSALRRTQSNGWDIGQCITLDEAQRRADAGVLFDLLLPVSEVFAQLPRLETGPWQARMLENGVALRLDKLGYPAPGRYAVWQDGRFLGLGVVEPDAEGLRLHRF
jgi:tRNA pseudouridine55 synthase